MKSARIAILIAAVVAAAAALPAVAAAPKPPAKTPPEIAAAEALGIGTAAESGLFHHTGAYPPLALAWQADGRVRQATGVFPHPVISDRILAATRGGLILSEDAGATWNALAEASAERIGLARSVAFSPDEADTFFVATDRRGVWVTRDAGKTFKQAGSKATGLASDETAVIAYYPQDRRFRTLLVAHGDAALGLSSSRDGGATWHVVAPDFHVRRILGGAAGDPDLFLVASRKAAPDVQNIYYCVSIDDFWLEVVHDIIPTDATVSLLVKSGHYVREVFQGGMIYFSTTDAGLYRVTQGEGFKVGPESLTFVASIGCTYGPTADSQILYACEPKKLGLLVSSDGWKTVTPQGAGLAIGAFIKEGACVRAAANGTAFYGVINDVLYVGRRRPAPFEVRRVAVTPAVFAFEDAAYKAAMNGMREALRAVATAPSAVAASRDFIAVTREARSLLGGTEGEITATVAAAGGPPASVTVDLSRLGGSPVTPMFDDGRHKDGAAGDGVWATPVRVDPRRLRRIDLDTRRRWPGPMGLTVTARRADGTLAGAVGVLAIYNRPESFTITGRKTQPIPVAGEPWEKAFRTGDEEPVDISGFHALTLRIKTDGGAAEEIRVHLRDSQPFSGATDTPPVPILQEKLIEGGKVDAEWRLVTIPLARLLKDAGPFDAARLAAVVVAGEGKVTGNYWIEDVRFHISPEDLKAYEGAKTP